MATPMQKRLAINLGDSRIKTAKEAMLKAGYSESTSNQQSNVLKESKTVRELLEEILPLDKAFKATEAALEANRKRAEITDRDDKGRPIYEYFEEEDHQTRLKATDQVYKLRKLYDDSVAQAGDVNIQIINYGENLHVSASESTQNVEYSHESITVQDVEVAPKSS